MSAAAFALVLLGGCAAQHADAAGTAGASIDRHAGTSRGLDRSENSRTSAPPSPTSAPPSPTSAPTSPTSAPTSPTSAPTPTPTASPTGTPTPGAKVITYTIKTTGTITANMNEFATMVSQTLNDQRGWAGLGLAFQQVPSGGRFTIWMAAANKLPGFSSGCSSLYSCTVGSNVIINQNRWLGASPSWTNAGGTLTDYRVMVINHETGHWLGHDHEHCAGSGQPAPLMQQQTIDMEGCTTNSWPLPNERTAPRLGIR